MERETLKVKKQRLELSKKMQRLTLSQKQSQACKVASLQTVQTELGVNMLDLGSGNVDVLRDSSRPPALPRLR